MVSFDQNKLLKIFGGMSFGTPPTTALFMVLASRASGCLFGHPNP